jgi:hypothetical protein
MIVASSDLRQWAIKGAEQRLVEIAEEAKAIYAQFPELREEGRGPKAQSALRTRTRTAAGSPEDGQPAKGGRRRRRTMSREARKRISEAQKARWAKQKAGQPAERTSAPSAPKETSRKKK